jgi:hypothetical protein
MKTTAGLKKGDKLYWYDSGGVKHYYEVVSIINDQKVEMRFLEIDGAPITYSIRFFHGRIKPPEPRIECWMNLYPDGLYPGPYDSEKLADRNAISNRIRCVHMREVREKKVKK